MIRKWVSLAIFGVTLFALSVGQMYPTHFRRNRALARPFHYPRPRAGLFFSSLIFFDSVLIPLCRAWAHFLTLPFLCMPPFWITRLTCGPFCFRFSQTIPPDYKTADLSRFLSSFPSIQKRAFIFAVFQCVWWVFLLVIPLSE